MIWHLKLLPATAERLRAFRAHLQPNERFVFSCEFVLIAPDERSARRLAQTAADDELIASERTWLDNLQTTCEQVEDDGRFCIISQSKR